MNEQVLRSLLNLEAEQSIDRFQIFDEIDSTNSESLRQIQARGTNNRLVVSEAQTAGRGRRGREWISPKNAGMYFSLTRGFLLEASALQSLSLVSAISVVEALHGLGAAKLQLKWPNDVLYTKKKLAGILLELQQEEPARFVVFGIGINIKLPVDAIANIDRPAIDLHSILDELPARELLLASVLNQLCRNLNEYERSGFSSFAQRWNELDCYHQTEVVIHNGESRIIGESRGVDSDGSLQIQTGDEIQSITSGEVFPSLRPLTETPN